MQTVYSWECPKCGKRYVNGKEPTYCEQSFFLKTPGHPLADADTGLMETRCGAPILPLTPPRVIPRAAPSEATWEEHVSDEARAGEGSIMETVLRVINARNWRHLVYGENTMVELSMGCRNSSIRLVANAREKEQQVIVYAITGTKVPPARRAAAAEFVARANHNFFVGGFDLDYDEGVVRFRCGIDVEGGVLTDKMVETLFDMTSFAADTHHERLMQVIYGGVEPKVALESEAE